MKQLTYAELLAEFMVLQGKHLVVSFSSEEMKAFTFFDAVLVRGFEAASPELLDHDTESIELQFSNGVTTTVDPQNVGDISVTSGAGGRVLKFGLADVMISMITVPKSGEDFGPVS